MINSRFDAWTRRRFGLATGGALAAALGLAAIDVAEAKKKKRKKRCRRINQSCKEDSKKKRCCKDLRCDEGKVVLSSLSCCRYFQARCDSEIECCTSFKCQPAVGLAGNRCCGALGVSCEEHADCCAGDGVICGSDHNCCRRVQASCQEATECCGELLCFEIFQGSGLRCCAPGGVACVDDDDCCIGSVCLPSGICGD
jgi:hypothetical protein